jgi:hypothetical protein
MDPILRATTATGAVYDDPSEDLIYELLGDIERDEEQFAVIQRLADTSGRTYAQVIKCDDGAWLVERRDRGPESHDAVTLPSLRQAHQALTSWAFELPESPPVRWSKLEL